MTYSNGFAMRPERRVRDDRRASRQQKRYIAPHPSPSRANTTAQAAPFRCYASHAYPAKRRAQRARRPFRLVALCALVAALAGCGWYAANTLSSLLSGAPAVASPDGPTSTPVAQWRKGDVPELYQRDPAWDTTTYAGAAFADSGCGPTCLAMVYSAVTGNTDRMPTDFAALSERMGCASEEGTAWAFMVDGAAAVGLAATELPADDMSIRRALNERQPVICSMAPGDFTTTGHFIVLAGIDADGRLLIRDPNSPERTAQAWDFDRVIPQCRNLWAYEAA